MRRKRSQCFRELLTDSEAADVTIEAHHHHQRMRMRTMNRTDHGSEEDGTITREAIMEEDTTEDQELRLRMRTTLRSSPELQSRPALPRSSTAVLILMMIWRDQDHTDVMASTESTTREPNAAGL